MKIIEYSKAAQNVTHLPPEVIEIILLHVRLRRSSRAVQKDLWSCCLVSQEWYGATIQYLYEAPLLLPRNFPNFSRTLSPSLSTRGRRLGLERLVQHLNMGLLAYESQKSTTSRLLSRTKSSLKSFVAPAVSFSTTSLAPLSKCFSLQHLDLSHDQYDFNLMRLLRSINDLSCLVRLSLPKDCPSSSDEVDELREDSWPKRLTSLHFNTSKTAALVSDGSNFVARLPQNLDDLTFNNLPTYDLFGVFEHKPSRVTKLTVRVNRCDGYFDFNSIVRPFPNLTKISIPAMTQWLFGDLVFSATGNSWSLTALPGKSVLARSLQVLVLEESPDFPYSDHIMTGDLRQFINNCPRLLRIEVPTAYLDVNDFIGNGTGDMDTTLAQRIETSAAESGTQLSKEEAGIFITEPGSNAGVGLKRSFHV